MKCAAIHKIRSLLQAVLEWLIWKNQWAGAAPPGREQYAGVTDIGLDSVIE